MRRGKENVVTGKKSTWDRPEKTTFRRTESLERQLRRIRRTKITVIRTVAVFQKTPNGDAADAAMMTKLQTEILQEKENADSGLEIEAIKRIVKPKEK